MTFNIKKFCKPLVLDTKSYKKEEFYIVDL